MQASSWGHIAREISLILHFLTISHYLNATTSCTCCHSTLWNINVKRAINDKLHGIVQRVSFIVNRLFSDILQGSVSTYARCSGMFNNHLTANLPKNFAVKKIGKSVKIWQNYGHEFGGLVFWPAPVFA